MLWGQWWGTTESPAKAELTLNIDRQTPGIGRVLLVQRQPNYVVGIATIQFDGETAGTKARFFVERVAPPPVGWDSAKASGEAEIVSIDEGNLVLKWRADWGDVGQARLIKLDQSPTHQPTGTFESWNDFKAWIAREERAEKGHIFRGQANAAWTLSTTFHRNGRRDLLRYNDTIVPRLSDTVAGTIDEYFDSSDGTARGSLLYLAQHHGFPTPLLDWTESPYIGAFFAFIDATPSDGQSVRLFVFDAIAWQSRFRNLANSDSAELYFNVHRFIPRSNPRAIPQQSVVTSTNVVQPEFFLRLAETQHRVQFLRAFDIPSLMRDEAIDDLAYMGISAASLFPGLDGACRALRERHF